MSNEPIAASLQHLALLHEKRARLATVQADTEAQICAAAARAYASGEMTLADLGRLSRTLSAGPIAGTDERWRAAFPVSRNKARAALTADENGYGPTATEYHGSTPLLPGQRYSPVGTCVVYVLFADMTPVYVGSTSNMRNRVDTHRKNGKRWDAWTAYRCNDRAHAYAVENEFLRAYMPDLNVAGARG